MKETKPEEKKKPVAVPAETKIKFLLLQRDAASMQLQVNNIEKAAEKINVEFRALIVATATEIGLKPEDYGFNQTTLEFDPIQK